MDGWIGWIGWIGWPVKKVSQARHASGPLVPLAVVVVQSGARGEWSGTSIAHPPVDHWNMLGYGWHLGLQ